MQKAVRLLVITSLTLLLNPLNPLFSQQTGYSPEINRIPYAYYGLGIGVNDYGLGINLEIPFNHHFSISGNAGLGGWGLKLGGNLNFYPTNVTGNSEFSIGFSKALGAKDFDFELSTEPSGEEKMVNLDLNPVQTVNLIYTKNIKIGRFGKLAFSGGYAFCITKNPYTVNDPVSIDIYSEQFLKTMQPGGLILGIRFMAGVL